MVEAQVISRYWRASTLPPTRSGFSNAAQCEVKVFQGGVKHHLPFQTCLQIFTAAVPIIALIRHGDSLIKD
jgi:hypothetical protein